jgi:putative heme transporter
VSSGSHVLDRAAAIVWRLLIVLLGIVVLGIIFQRLLILFLSVVVALFLTTLLVPPVTWLVTKGMPRILATFLVMIVAFGSLVGLGFLLAPTIAEQFDDLGPTLEEGRDEVETWLQEGPLELTNVEIRRYTDQIGDAFQGNQERIMSGVVSGVLVAVEVIIGFLMMLLLTFFFVKDADKITGWFLRHMRNEHHDLARALGRRAWVAGGGYIRGTAIVALVDAVGIGIGLWILGVPLVLPLAILTFFGGFFPLVGATAAGTVAVLVALVDGGLTTALLALLVVLAVQQFEGNVLEPVILSRAVRIHPIAVLAALTTGGILGGIPGAFVAVPTLAVIVAISAELRERDIIGPDAPYKRQGRADASPADASAGEG